MTTPIPRGTDGHDIAVERLAVGFGDGAGLVDVSLTVRGGERLAIVGASGAGKTTLLRTIAGLTLSDAGTIRIGGREVTRLPPERRGAVYLNQAPVLFAHLDVAENVAFPLRVRGERGPTAHARVRASLEAMQLGGFERRSAHSLSGGQRHRVALARAIAGRPAALLLDEPLSALDPTLREDVRSAIVAAQEEYGPAMMLVTHDLDDAGLLADRVAVLLDGRVAQVATPAALYSRPASLAVARFLGLYEEFPGRVVGDGHVECALGVLAAHAPGPATRAGECVIVMVRAAGVHVGLPVPGVPCGEVVAIRQRARGTTYVAHCLDGGLGVDVEGASLAPQQEFSVGDAVGLSIDPRHTLVFPA